MSKLISEHQATGKPRAIYEDIKKHFGGASNLIGAMVRQLGASPEEIHHAK